MIYKIDTLSRYLAFMYRLNIARKNIVRLCCIKVFTHHLNADSILRRWNKTLPIYEATHITLEIVGLPGVDNISGVGQAGPVVQAGDVVGMVDLDLVLLGQFKGHHVDWQIELSL